MSMSRNTYEGMSPELVRAVRREVAALRRTRAICSADVEDFEQELALHGWKIEGRYRKKSGASLATFLTRALRRKALTLLRARVACNRIPPRLLES